MLFILGANLTLISCTDQSLAEVEEQNPPFYAEGDTTGGNGGEDGQLDPPPDPPGSGN